MPKTQVLVVQQVFRAKRTNLHEKYVYPYPKWVTLFFLHGALLDDPTGLLEGEGVQVRSIRLQSSLDIDTPQASALIAQAALEHQSVFAGAPPLTTIIKSVAARQRPRRPSSGASSPNS